MDVFSEIKKLLEEKNLSFEVMEHEPCHTSEQAAKIRGTRIEQGAKALVFRSEGKFLMAVVAGDTKVDFKKLKKVIGSKKLTLATPDEVFAQTHCKIGSVPPFGNLFGLPVYCDVSLTQNKKIWFNAGKHEVSMGMPLKAWLEAVEPKVEDFGG